MPDCLSCTANPNEAMIGKIRCDDDNNFVAVFLTILSFQTKIKMAYKMRSVSFSFFFQPSDSISGERKRKTSNNLRREMIREFVYGVTCCRVFSFFILIHKKMYLFDNCARIKIFFLSLNYFKSTCNSVGGKTIIECICLYKLKYCLFDCKKNNEKLKEK